MKLSSPRTWLVVAAGLLLLAGGIVLYVIKNPPLPKGWMKFDCELFCVSLPPGELGHPIANLSGAFTERHGYDVTHIPLLGGWIEIAGYSGELSGSITPDEFLDHEVTRMTFHPTLAVTIPSCEKVQFRGFPGRILTSTLRREDRAQTQRRCLIVLAKGWLHVVTVHVGPALSTEEEADLVIRSFRPK